MTYILAAVGYSAVVALLVRLLQRIRPEWCGGRIVVRANLPGPAVVVLGGFGLAVAIGRAPPGEIDARGIELAVYLVGGALLTTAMIAIGTVAGCLARCGRR